MRISRSVPHHTSVWIAKCVNHKDIYSAAKNHSTDDGVRVAAQMLKGFAPALSYEAKRRSEWSRCSRSAVGNLAGAREVMKGGHNRFVKFTIIGAISSCLQVRWMIEADSILFPLKRELSLTTSRSVLRSRAPSILATSCTPCRAAPTRLPPGVPAAISRGGQRVMTPAVPFRVF